MSIEDVIEQQAPKLRAAEDVATNMGLRVLMRRLEARSLEAIRQLVEVDPAETAKIRELQGDVKRWWALADEVAAIGEEGKAARGTISAAQQSDGGGEDT